MRNESVESEVLARYAAAAASTETELCCPTRAATDDVSFLPAEIVAKDYGCGDPTAFVREGETVVDLGSGSGKAAFLLARRVGARGRVIGVDMNDAMLALARRHQAAIAARLGHDNVRFVKARIQNLALDLEEVERLLVRHPLASAKDLAEFEDERARLERDAPLVPSESVDVVVSNCVLNLVRPEDKRTLFVEMFRVLKRGGRAVISDIVCDEDPTPAIRADPKLWSGCISGAFREDRFLEAFAAAGFYGVEILARSTEPWRVIDGVEFRSITVRAFKGKEGPCLERNQAVIYRGPWRSVSDDDGHEYARGERVAVCDKTFRILTDAAGPYSAHVIAVPPRVEVPLAEAAPFRCRGTTLRDPRETKGAEYRASDAGRASPDCSGGDCC